jgi:hypothetical protein
MSVTASTGVTSASPYVFRHGDGSRFSTFANSFSIIAKEAGVPFGCHDLRHRFSSSRTA